PMHCYIITVASTAASGTENYPYLFSLVALAISLAAIFQVSGLRRALNNKPAATTPAPQAPAPAASRQASSPREDEIAPEIVAVIAAAVHTVTGRNRRIISIKKVDTSWEKSGRQSVLTSHRIR
ncbi:MAG: OadG family transporter subunit, partial [Verrucomicrobiota bacterium]